MGNVIWTIGTQERSPFEVLEILRCAGVQTLVDVRANPGGRFDPCRRDVLAALAGSVSIGVEYIWLPALGVPSSTRNVARRAKDPFAYVEAWYAAQFTRDPLTQAAADVLLHRIMDGGKLALLCYEHDPAICHRRLLAEHLAGMVDGLRVVHL